MTTQTLPSMSPALDRRGDVLQFRLIFGLAFVVMLPVTTCSRLLVLAGQRSPAGRRSILAEAWEASGTVAHLAFAG